MDIERGSKFKTFVNDQKIGVEVPRDGIANCAIFKKAEQTLKVILEGKQNGRSSKHYSRLILLNRCFKNVIWS